VSPSTPSTSALADDVLRSLLTHGLSQAEVYTKRGRSRRLEIAHDHESSLVTQEKGWAIRAGTRRGSFFFAGTGNPPPTGPWPQPAAGSCELPSASDTPPWSEPSDFEAPLLGEREGWALISALGKHLAEELPGARLLRGVLEDGSSDGELVSSRSLQARFRHRVASLFLHAAGPGRQPAVARLYVAAREARRFPPQALARRLADHLSVLGSGGQPALEAGELLLAPQVAAQLLAGLLPLWVGAEAGERGAPFRDRRGRIAADVLTLIDNGRFPGGIFEAARDGEGVPCREVVLVEEGLFRQPLLGWSEASGPNVASGCSRRASWRDFPQRGPTHLYVTPDPKVSVGALLGSIGSGHYLIEATGPGRFDFAADRFTLPVCGFVLAQGRAIAPVGSAQLTGRISAFLNGIVGIGRDLAFQPLDGMIGSPSLLVTGLELIPGPPPMRLPTPPVPEGEAAAAPQLPGEPPETPDEQPAEEPDPEPPAESPTDPSSEVPVDPPVGNE
jgi:predicted Zn-dependent protease